MTDNELMARADRVIAKTYGRFPLVLTRGRGVTLYDSGGKAFTWNW